jgi:hypothetical protein
LKEQSLRRPFFGQSRKTRGTRLSLPALDNHVDKFWQLLYDHAKCLIHKGKPRIACFSGKLQGLSHPALDNHGDKSGQVLYRQAKCLICKDYPCIAQKQGSFGKAPPGLDLLSI